MIKKRLPERRSGAFFYLFFGRDLTLDPPGTDIILLTAIVPEITDITRKLHRIRFYLFLHPAEPGMNILKPEILAAETHFFDLLHTHLFIR
jgi:hypothetical protein